jgi:hypothetical protein
MFRTPAETAASENKEDSIEETIDMGTAEAPTGNQKKPRRSLKEWLKTRTKKQWVIIIVIAVLLLGGIGTATYFLFIKKDAAVVGTTKKKAAPVVKKPTTVAANLTGVPVDPTVNDRAVTAVMIENSLDARPQSSLEQAGVVFEAVAEGGITRFCALFQDTQPAYIGPVRSVRPYYIQWAFGFDAAIAHVGGSAEALANMREWGVKDLDQFANGGFFQRISSRAAPHNVYTSISQLNELEGKRGYGKANYTPLARKKEQPAKTPTATSVDVNISGASYNSHWDYDATTNAYKRSQAGAPHMQVDASGTQAQIQPKVVVTLIMSQGIAADGVHSAYGSIGSGTAIIFQDGTATEAKWTKNSRQENLKFTDASGKTIGLNPGQTWFTAVGDKSRVTYR